MEQIVNLTLEVTYSVIDIGSKPKWPYRILGETGRTFLLKGSSLNK
jgi:hypothetical protein